MSENLDLVRSIYAAWERGDFSSAVWAHPEIEFALADGPDPGTWTGLPGMAEGYRTWLSAWTNFRAEPEEYLVLDDERILVLVHNTGRGRTSGLSLDERSPSERTVDGSPRYLDGCRSLGPRWRRRTRRPRANRPGMAPSRPR